MTEADLYEATRKSWVIGNRRYNARYAVSTYRGLTREAYEVKHPYQKNRAKPDRA